MKEKKYTELIQFFNVHKIKKHGKNFFN